MTILFSLYFFMHFISSFSIVKYGRSSNSLFGAAYYSLITSTVAMLFFSVSTGFSPLINLTTVKYAILLAAVVIVSQYSSVLVYGYMNVLDAGITRSSLTLILTFFVGAKLYDEVISNISVLRMILSLGATVTLFLHNSGKTGIIKRRNTMMGYAICAMLIFMDILFTIGVKSFAMLKTPHDESSLFLLTNVFSFIFSAIVCIAITKGNFQSMGDELREIGFKNMGYIVSATVTGNAESLLYAKILSAENSVVLFLPLSAAISVINQVIIAKIAAKEKIPKLPVILSLLSGFLLFFSQ